MEVFEDQLEARYRLKSTRELIALTIDKITPTARDAIERELSKRNVPEQKRRKLHRKALKKAQNTVVISDELASPWVRLLAKLVDSLIGTAIVLFPLILPAPSNEQLAVILASGFGGVGLIYVYLSDWIFSGRGLGKRLFGIICVNEETNRPCTFGQSLGRNLVLYLLSFIDALFIFRASRKRLGDSLAGTAVKKVVKYQIDE